MRTAPRSMQRESNFVSCLRFSPTKFSQLVHKASQASTETARNNQTEYLGRYLGGIGAKSLVVEWLYVDRNYMEEYATYYSRCLLPRPSTAVRIHVFSSSIANRDLDKFIAKAGKRFSDLREVEKLLSDRYLGFVVVRPIPSVPIGRTVLVGRSDSSDRRFPGVVPYNIHFLGLSLTVKGVAFQQQDRAVAACATTAVWTALQSVCKLDGAKVPTTFQITEAAIRHTRAAAHTIPNRGLTVAETCDALRGFGYAPDLFDLHKLDSERLDLAHLCIGIYLRSGLPVILALSKDKGDGHAVTVVGYDQASGSRHSITLNTQSFGLRHMLHNKIYIHDDRLGPYSRAHIRKENGNLNLAIPYEGKPDDVLHIKSVITPLYPKVRTNAEELFRKGCIFLHTVRESTGGTFEMEFFFTRSGDYLRERFEYSHDDQRLIHFMKTAALSRYVGVVRYFSEDRPLFDVLWDTTDRTRQESLSEQLLGVVSLRTEANDMVNRAAKIFKVISG